MGSSRPGASCSLPPVRHAAPPCVIHPHRGSCSQDRARATALSASCHAGLGCGAVCWRTWIPAFAGMTGRGGAGMTGRGMQERRDNGDHERESRDGGRPSALTNPFQSVTLRPPYFFHNARIAAPSIAIRPRLPTVRRSGRGRRHPRSPPASGLRRSSGLHRFPRPPSGRLPLPVIPVALSVIPVPPSRHSGCPSRHSGCPSRHSGCPFPSFRLPFPSFRRKPESSRLSGGRCRRRCRVTGRGYAGAKGQR